MIDILHSSWTKREIAALFDLPFDELMWEAQANHRRHHGRGEVELCTFMRIDRAEAGRPVPLSVVRRGATAAKAAGVQRFCISASWPKLESRNLGMIVAMIEAVRDSGLETCACLGLLTREHAEILGAAGLDFYNTPICEGPARDRSRRDSDDATFAATREHLRVAGIGICASGGVVAGEGREDHIAFVLALASLSEPPECVSLTLPPKGAPDTDGEESHGACDDVELVRLVAIIRMICPTAMIRLSAGREDLAAPVQALCFMAGANSIFSFASPSEEREGVVGDAALFRKLGLEPVRMGEGMLMEIHQ